MSATVSVHNVEKVRVISGTLGSNGTKTLEVIVTDKAGIKTELTLFLAAGCQIVLGEEE